MIDPNIETRLSESKPDPFLGQEINGYRVEALIGRGGMGAVYRAIQLSLGRSVALKILPPDLAQDRQFLERFRREADVLCRLSHPNIVTVFDRGEWEGHPYLVLEYVEGTNLREVMRRGALPAPEALKIVSSVLAALEHAHAHGIVHRDVKPENVLMAKSSIVKVADFGLSRLLDPDKQTRLTRTHLTLGTFEYMAPEQRERSKEADERSDLYATGVVLYEMLTGELPIGRFELPSHKRPEECDRRIDDVIAKSLDKNPDGRYQRANEMASAVSAILDRPESQGPSPRSGFAQERPSNAGPYSPVRFEYHFDNIATINQVLGVVCYVLGAIGLFAYRSALLGVPFWVLFIFGWYLRATGEKLQKFRTEARTSQAVISVLSCLTVFLAPFGIYSLWALFGHRGRTYYEARSRGLSEIEAAQHTQRILEDPFHTMDRTYEGTPEGMREAGVPQPPPTPSQIPVMSQVVPEAAIDRDRYHGPATGGQPAKRRCSKFVTVGFLLMLLAFGAVIVTQLLDVGLTFRVLTPMFGFGCLFLVLGFFHSLFTGKRGAGLAFFGLCFFGGTAFFLLGVDELQADHDHAFHEFAESARINVRLGVWSGPVPDSHDVAALLRDGETAAWLVRLARPVGDSFEGAQLLIRPGEAWLEIPRSLARDDQHMRELVYAVGEALESAFPGSVDADTPWDVPTFAREVSRNPPPSGR